MHLVTLGCGDERTCESECAETWYRVNGRACGDCSKGHETVNAVNNLNACVNKTDDRQTRLVNCDRSQSQQYRRTPTYFQIRVKNDIVVEN